MLASYRHLFSPLIPALIASLAAGMVALPATAEIHKLPDLGSSARTAYSQMEEEKIGHEVMVQIRQSRSFIDDPEVQTYIQTLGTRLAKQAGSRRFQFFLINDSSINAFALPGGYIGINSGLIINADNESELAAVIAHEIIHVDQQHWSRMMAARKERSSLTAAALLASLVLASSNPQVGEAGIAITSAASITQELAYSRDYEREADRLGIQLLARAGYRSESMADFFERLQQSHRLMGASGPEYLYTHPIESNRIAEARDRARKLRVAPGRDQSEFLFAKARIITLYAKNASIAETQLESNLGSKFTDAYDYGRALLLLRVNRAQEALTIVTRLRRKRPGDLRFLALEADINLKLANRKQGLAKYQAAYQQSGERKDIMLRYAIALINYREYERAYQLLRKARSHPPQYPQIEKLYAQAAGETGRLLQAHRALAEYYYLQGNTPAALQQLRIARSHAGDNKYLLAGIDARIKEIEASE